jgi:dTDP-4-dehydrorhamnose 3,5-epimerase
VRATASDRIDGLLSIELDAFTDARGVFFEAFNADDWRFTRPDGSPIVFVEDDYSVNRRGVVRGLHGDNRTWKLVTCVHGSLFVVVADTRTADLLWEGFDLDQRAPRQLLVPPGCATGMASLEDGSVFAYKQSERYLGAGEQFSLRWDDPALGIEWPVSNPILSERDANAPLR